MKSGRRGRWRRSRWDRHGISTSSASCSSRGNSRHEMRAGRELLRRVKSLNRGENKPRPQPFAICESSLRPMEFQRHGCFRRSSGWWTRLAGGDALLPRRILDGSGESTIVALWLPKNKSLAASGSPTLASGPSFWAWSNPTTTRFRRPRKSTAGPLPNSLHFTDLWQLEK